VADSSVTLEVILEGKNLKIVQKDVDKVTSSVNRASKSTENLSTKSNNYNKGQKGVAQATSNSTKAFSKMRSEIGGGSSGLVAAYATLAANLFAATAAFNALRGASKVEELSKSLDVIGTKAGRNLGILAESLRDVTNAAISTEQALRTAAIATSAGFSDSQLLSLTKVAKGASIALGRDLGDSLDRLVRGTAKLEPEILDELGIFVRLDDATREYARALGKTSDELTDFERRQAFLNSAIEKGEKRFGELAEALDTNPYDKLSAAFRDLAKNLVTAINGTITPVIGYLSQNLTALAGVSLLAGSGVAKNVVSAFVQGAEGAATFAGKLSDQRKELLQNLETTDKLPAVYKNVSSKIKEGTASLDDYKTAFRSLEKSTKTHQGQLDAMKDGTKKFSFTVKEKEERLLNVNTTLKNLRTQLVVTTAAQANFTKAQALGAIQAGSYIAGIKLAYAAVKEYASGLWAAVAGAGALATANAALKITFFAIGIAVQTAFAAVLSAIAIIGILIALGPQLKDWIESTFFPEKIIQRRRKEIVDSLNIIQKTSRDFTKNFFNDQQTAADAAKKASGLIQESISAVEKASKLDAEAQKKREEELFTLKEKQLEQQEELKKFKNPNAIANAKGELAKTKKAIEELQNTNMNALITNSNAIEVANKAVENFYSVLDSRDQFSLLPQSSIEQIDEAIALLETGGPDAVENFINTLTKIKEPFDKITAGFESVTGKINDFKDAQATLLKRTATPYDDILEAAKGVQAEIKAITDNTSELAEVTGGTVIARDILEKITDAGFESQEQLDTYITTLEEGIKKYIEFPGLIKQQETALKRLNNFAKEDVNVLQQSLEKRTELNKVRENALINEENLIKANQKEGQEGQAQAARLLEIEREKAVIAEEELKSKYDEQTLAVARVEEQQKLLDLSKKVTGETIAQAKAQMEIRNIAREIERLEAGGGEYSASAKLAIFSTERKAREDVLALEYSMKVAGIELEYDLMEAKFELLKKQAEVEGVKLTNTEKIEKLMKDGRAAALANAETQNELSLKRLELEEAQLQKQVRSERSAFTENLGGIGSGFATTTSMTSDIENSIKTGQGNITKINEGKGTEPEKEAAIARERLAMAASAAGPFVEQLKALGPEGALVAAVTEGSMVMADAFLRIGEAGDNMGDKLSAIGNVIGAIGGIAQAAGQARVAAIDKEIAAEKKRDGKSKESLAKLAQLEKKKEGIERKNFERNKKIQMAQIVINTAAAYMKTLGETGFFGIPLGAIILGLGAAQLALVAGQSYEGGGSSVGAGSAPSPTVELGKRKSSVDLASSQSASGELAYFRGERGIGGPENFVPTGAMMGAKYRNEGGPTAGYMVGEQGPELFVPSVPGTIVPNDEITATSQNVNISINAIDSRGIEQVLVEQRGNIIGMIRSAANNVGEDFYETIDTSVYTAEAAGATRY